MCHSKIEQCKKLYKDAFHDDDEFTDLIFSRLGENGLKCLFDGDRVVSMLFLMDVSCEQCNGKYVYGVVTHPAYRGRGKMAQLFDKVAAECKNDCDFLCLRPMSDSLFGYYSKLGFETMFKKSIAKCTAKISEKAVKIDSIQAVKGIRKKLLCNSYVEYSDVFYELLYSYCDSFTDSINNPTWLITAEKLSGKVKEALGNTVNLPEAFAGKELLKVGNDFDFAMIKFLNGKKFDNGYLGFAMD